jgi:hypothetical protein
MAGPAAIAPVHASGGGVVLESALTCGGATLLNLAAEPLVRLQQLFFRKESRSTEIGSIEPPPP